MTLLWCLLLVTGCAEPAAADPDPGAADAARGRAIIESLECGTCHTIPGIAGADATVGPPLDAMWRQAYVAGVLPNTPENLVRWILDPPSIDPRTAMPDLGVTQEQARDIAAYLYSIDEGQR